MRILADENFPVSSLISCVFKDTMFGGFERIFQA